MITEIFHCFIEIWRAQQCGRYSPIYNKKSSLSKFLTAHNSISSLHNERSSTLLTTRLSPTNTLIPRLYATVWLMWKSLYIPSVQKNKIKIILLSFRKLKTRLILEWRQKAMYHNFFRFQTLNLVNTQLFSQTRISNLKVKKEFKIDFANLCAPSKIWNGVAWLVQLGKITFQNAPDFTSSNQNL